MQFLRSFCLTRFYLPRLAFLGIVSHSIALTAAPAPAQATTQQPRRIAIIKADDVTRKTSKWENFFRLNREKGIKVSAGIIGISLDTGEGEPSAEKLAYLDWLRQLAAAGDIEFWHHGWDHKRWQEGERKVSEYGGSGYSHQLEHTLKTQEAARAVFGKPFAALGTPFNAMDKDSVRVFNELPELRMIFSHTNRAQDSGLEGKVLLPMALRGEHNGTGKPDFEKFRADYEARGKELTFAAIQVHPQSFPEGALEEYGKIIDLLKADGWEFVLPSEYLEIVTREATAHNQP